MDANRLEGVAAGCVATRSYALEHADQVLDRLGSRAFGYVNPDFTVEEVCPWTEGG
jgi:hypothetical protein